MNHRFLLGLLFVLCGVIGICFSVLSFVLLEIAHNFSAAGVAAGVLFLLSVSLLAVGAETIRKNIDSNSL